MHFNIIVTHCSFSCTICFMETREHQVGIGPNTYLMKMTKEDPHINYWHHFWIIALHTYQFTISCYSKSRFVIWGVAWVVGTIYDAFDLFLVGRTEKWSLSTSIARASPAAWSLKRITKCMKHSYLSVFMNPMDSGLWYASHFCHLLTHTPHRKQ